MTATLKLHPAVDLASDLHAARGQDLNPDHTAIAAQLDILDQHSATLLPYLSGAQIPRTPRERATLDHALRALCEQTPQLITALRHALLHVPASTLEQIEDLLTP